MCAPTAGCQEFAWDLLVLGGQARLVHTWEVPCEHPQHVVHARPRGRLLEQSRWSILTQVACPRLSRALISAASDICPAGLKVPLQAARHLQATAEQQCIAPADHAGLVMVQSSMPGIPADCKFIWCHILNGMQRIHPLQVSMPG